MISNDNQQYLNVDKFNAKMDVMIANIQLANEKLHNEIHNEIQDVKSEVKANSTQIADLQHSVYWGFAIIAVIIALVGFIVSLAPAFLEFLKNKKTYTTAEQVQEIVDKAIAKAFSSISK